MIEQRDENIAEESFKVSRRQLLTVGGATLVGAALIGLPQIASASAKPLSRLPDDWMKEVVLPMAGTKDPVAFSIAESRFWNEQMMEHAQFFIMLMPGAELAD